MATDAAAEPRREVPTRNELRSKRQRYNEYVDKLFVEQQRFMEYWRLLAMAFMPSRPRWLYQRSNERNKGTRMNKHIIDSSPLFAVRTLKSGLHSGLTSPARPWMRLTVPDPDLAAYPTVKKWLFTVTQRMLTVFARSNLYSALPNLYGDLGVFAIGAIGVLQDEKDVLRVTSYPIGSFACDIDKRGVVGAFCRDYEMTVEQVVEEFGRRPDNSIDWSNISTRVKNDWDKGDYINLVRVRWLVQRNNDYTGQDRIGAKNKRFNSCYWESENNEDKFLRESGFDTFPFMVPRWDVAPEDTYGTDCPGMMALGDSRQLQVQQRQKGRAIEKMVEPPLQAPPALKNKKVSHVPGDTTTVEPPQSGRAINPLYEVKPDLQHFVLDLNAVAARIDKSFFVDLFQMMAYQDAISGSQQPVTAREIAERHEEKLLALGSVYERLNDELLDLLIDRAFFVMMQLGMIPDPPQELLNMDLRVEYISLMAQAQKLIGLSALDRYGQTAIGLSQVFPGVVDKVDEYKLMDEYADVLMINPSITRSDEDAAARGQARAQAMQQQMRDESLATQAKATKDLANSPSGGDTALEDLKRTLGAA